MALGKLAAAEQVKAPTMSRVVAGLKRSGLVEIDADASDARRILVKATAKGARILQKARVRRIRLIADSLSGLKDRETQTLLRASELIEQALGRSPSRK